MLGLSKADFSFSVGSLFDQINDYHPDNVAGGSAIYSSLLNTDELIVPAPGDSGIEIDPQGNILIVGGPVGTKYSRIALEFDGPDPRHLERSADPIIPLRWYGLANVDDPRVKDRGKVFYMMEKVGPVSPSNWPLIDTHRAEPWVVETGTRLGGLAYDLPTYWLRDNYLTITRIPNFLSVRGADLLSRQTELARWPQLVILDGRNGLGTRGAELLTMTTGDEALRGAAHAIRNFGSAYQLLFRLTNLATDAAFSRFVGIEFIDAFEIHIDQGVLARAFAYAQRRLHPERL